LKLPYLTLKNLSAQAHHKTTSSSQVRIVAGLKSRRKIVEVIEV